MFLKLEKIAFNHKTLGSDFLVNKIINSILIIIINTSLET